jgi:nicotinamidase-related amidase
MPIRKHAVIGGLIATLTAVGPAYPAADQPDIVREWSSVVPPPSAPPLTAVTVVPEKTALLLIAFDKNVCNGQVRDRCPAAVPKTRWLLDQARAKHMLVVHAHNNVTRDSDIVPELAPQGGEVVFRTDPDKFLGSDFEKILKERGITTVLLTGTAGNGAVLFTLIAGVSRGFDFFVPVDAIPADSSYHEQFAVFEMADVMFLHALTTLTRSDMIRFN